MRHWVIYALVAVIVAVVGAGTPRYFMGTTHVEVEAGVMRAELLVERPSRHTLTTEANGGFYAHEAEPCRT